MRIHHATAAKAKKFQITLTVEDNEIVATGKTGARLASGLQGNKVLEDAITKSTGKVAKGAVKVRLMASGAELGKAIAQAARKAEKPAKAAKPVIEADPFEVAAKAEGWKKTRWGFRNADDSENQPEATTWQELCEELEIEAVEPHSEEEAELDNDEEGGTKSVVKAKYKAKYKPTKNRCGDELSHRMNEHCSREDDAGDMRIDLDALRKFAKANECWVESYASFKSRTGGWNGGFAMMNTNNRIRARLRRIAKEQGRAFDIDKDIVWK